MRASGILMGISSIPSKYGIGCFSKEAYEFVDQLEKAGQQYWQILPLEPTGYGDSPYQSVSTFAGNPYFISLEDLIEEKLLTREECESCDWGGSESYVDYEKMYMSRYKLLRKAYERSDFLKDKDYEIFLKEEKNWLTDYCLFMAIKNSQKGICWIDWPDELKDRHSKAVKEAEKELETEINFYRFQQYCFTTQWRKLKKYANKKGISIIGDVPIYVALDSSDAWANPEMLQFDKDHNPKSVAGCPPDAFSATGQLWGNPLYDWKKLKASGYDWWVQRMKHCLELYDVVRIDHFRGFDEYYAIPYGEKTARKGEWEKGPGMDLFNTLNKKLENLHVIAEDLGFLTESVLEMLKESGYPGLKVLQFAFDGSEDSSYLPYKYDHNCVVYTGTHDNETTKGWLENLQGHDLKFVREYINCYEQQIYDYVVSNLTYDYEKADTVTTGYLPDVDETLKTGTGICFDYAALTTAMLRSCDIPCKLQIGYAGDIKHAWIDVYIRSKGWVNQAVSFKGDTWTLMDPTFDSNSDDKEAIQNYIGDESNYTVQFTR